MKIILLYYFFGLLAIQSFGQNQFQCGTKPPSNIDSVQARAQGRIAWGPTAWWPIPRCSHVTIQVSFHIVRRDDGTGGFDNSASNAQTHILQVLNAKFNFHNIFFVRKPIQWFNTISQTWEDVDYI